MPHRGHGDWVAARTPGCMGQVQWAMAAGSSRFSGSPVAPAPGVALTASRVMPQSGQRASGSSVRTSGCMGQT